MRLRALAWWAFVLSGCDTSPAPPGESLALHASAFASASQARSAPSPAKSPIPPAQTHPPGLASGAACLTTPGATAPCDRGLECFEIDPENRSGICATLVSVNEVVASERGRFLGGFIGVRDATIEAYGEHCAPRLDSAPRHCGSSLRINDQSGYLFLTSNAGYGYKCTFRRNGGKIEAKSCHPEPGRYEVIVGKLTRRETGWGKLEVAGLRKARSLLE